MNFNLSIVAVGISLAFGAGSAMAFNTATTDQLGTGHVSTVNQSISSATTMTQKAVIDQRGDYQKSSVTQTNKSGDGMNAVVYQSGWNNDSTVKQTGDQRDGNIKAYVTQIGVNNDSGITQKGHDQFAAVFQSGFGNKNTIGQEGHGHKAWVTQIGMYNTSTTSQAGINQFASTLQLGNGIPSVWYWLGGQCFPILPSMFTDHGRSSDLSTLISPKVAGTTVPVQRDQDDVEDNSSAEVEDGVQADVDANVAKTEAKMLRITPRQYQVLVLLGRGYPIKTISRHLNISISTAKAHRETLYQRLDVNNRSEAVYTALARGATLGWDQNDPATATSSKP